MHIIVVFFVYSYIHLSLFNFVKRFTFNDHFAFYSLIKDITKTDRDDRHHGASYYQGIPPHEFHNNKN